MRSSELITKTVELLSSSQKTIALTGAGISVESGIAPFRGKGGLWEKYDPDEYAHVISFLKTPDRSWQMLKEMGEQIFSATPNPAHKALTTLQKKGLLETIITQNVDHLHQEAGNTDFVEFHGNYKRLSCLICGAHYSFKKDQISSIPPPPKCQCGAVLKPDVILFGEAPPKQAMMRAQEAVSTCEILLVIGTSALVYPAAHLPVIAKKHQSKIIEINMAPTPLTEMFSDVFLQGSASDILKEIGNML
jgi:NAD-dependent deacetylase